MSDLYSKRMELLYKAGNGTVGSRLKENSSIIEDITFTNNVNYKRGMLYDWDMNELEEVDFKLEKHRTNVAEEREIEYFIRFRPGYNPEFKFKDKFFRNDGKERLGFYIDVPDYDKGTITKWILAGKDDKEIFDRYNAFKCNWCFEWVDKNDNYHSCIGVLRDYNDSSAKGVNNSLMESSQVEGATSFLMPTNKSTSTINPGTRFMVNDGFERPQTYEIIKIRDTSPAGTTKVYTRQCLYNQHTDVEGNVNNMSNYTFRFSTPINDLPDGFGGNHHMICDAVKAINLSDIIKDGEIEDENISTWKLSEVNKNLYINGQPETIVATYGGSIDKECEWHILLDGVEYTAGQLSSYFEINIQKNNLTIRAINKVMANYILKIAIYDALQTYYDSVEMEVRI